MILRQAHAAWLLFDSPAALSRDLFAEAPLFVMQIDGDLVGVRLQVNALVPDCGVHLRGRVSMFFCQQNGRII